MKKFISLFLCVVLVFALTVPSFAENDTVQGNAPEVIQAWRVINGEVIEISVEDYYEIVNSVNYDNSTDSISKPIVQPRAEIYYNFDKDTEYTYYDEALPVSACVTGPGYVFAGTSVSVSSSFSVSLVAEAKLKIIDSLTATAEISASSQSGSFSGGVFYVTAGYYGKVMFQPKMVYTAGTLTTHTFYNNGEFTSDTYVTGSCPVTLGNGIADGLYTLVRDTSPF